MDVDKREENYYKMNTMVEASFNRATKINQLIYTDLMKLMKITSLNGSRFIVIFVDDRSHKSWLYFLKTSGETLQKFKQFKTMIDSETNNKIEILKTDRNGVAKRRNRAIIEKGRNLQYESKLPIYLWSKMVNIENYLINKGLTRTNGGETPKKRWTKKKLKNHELYDKVDQIVDQEHIDQAVTQHEEQKFALEQNENNTKTGVQNECSEPPQEEVYNDFDDENDLSAITEDMMSLLCDAIYFEYLIGSLIHLQITRFDIVFAIYYCFRYMNQL
uniref:Integrase catalytic domain-containing protein n=1 Tax=Physcomitrium patens TaxID=3218 RepID=A0A2K1L6S9_PHYPA|nr:hypothetical protein PHYPA_000162 [Physcomitrium patens]